MALVITVSIDFKEAESKILKEYKDQRNKAFFQIYGRIVRQTIPSVNLIKDTRKR